jgi:hypothetical protein
MRTAFTGTLTLVLTILAPGAYAQSDYGWSLSGSSVDPFANTGPDPPPGTFTVYLWLYCSADDLPLPGGASAAEFDVQTSAGWSVIGFTPSGGVLNAGTPTALLLAIGGCPGGPFLAGSFTLFDAAGTGGEACLVPSAMNGINVTVDCDALTPLQHDNAITGYSTSGVPCFVGPMCLWTDALSETSWGSVKGMYR